MRYLVITYYKKPNGETDEAMDVTKNLKTRDIQCANVILDFKKLEVVKASMGGVQVPKVFDNVVGYYRQHYKAVIDRLFAENGFEVMENAPEAAPEESKETTNAA